MNAFLQCISCGARSRGDDDAATPLARRTYTRTQSLDRSYRRRRFRSAAPADWHPSLSAISEESPDSSSRGGRRPQQKQLRSSSRQETMKRCGSGKSIDCRCNSFAAFFAGSTAAPFMF
uniref:Uncharacterized protein n=1 Tax=Kalanchoe fedtschenkoi TaxID=63787 RepID=A0A7N0RD99_KALFE